jgi:hypothetical protein
MMLLVAPPLFVLNDDTLSVFLKRENTDLFLVFYSRIMKGR